VKITFDAAKRAAVIETRGIDMRDAAKVFDGPTATWSDDRFDYGVADRRVSCRPGRVDRLDQRGETRRVISMRYCHAKEVRKFRRRFPEAFGDETR
jgi:uncharacterized protein